MHTLWMSVSKQSAVPSSPHKNTKKGTITHPHYNFSGSFERNHFACEKNTLCFCQELNTNIQTGPLMLVHALIK